jgi:hypothetical protein
MHAERSLFVSSEECVTLEPFLLGNDIDFGRYTFRHAECDVSDINVKQGLCCHCLRAKPLLMRRFDSNLRLHTEEFNPNRRADLDKTPSLINQRVLYYSTQYKRVSRRLSYKAKALAKLTEDTGVECPINEDSDQIFDITMEENVKRFLSRDSGDCQQAKLHGRRSIRHSPRVIRLAAAVYASMGNAGGAYDLLARCFNFSNLT